MKSFVTVNTLRGDESLISLFLGDSSFNKDMIPGKISFNLVVVTELILAAN